jgi:hypothetical protein
MAPAVPAEKDAAAQGITMFGKLGRLFVIKTRFEACAIIYALALGAVERGQVYLSVYPGFGGKLLFLACTAAVFMAGSKIFDCLRHEQAGQAAAIAPGGSTPASSVRAQRSNPEFHVPLGIAALRSP